MESYSFSKILGYWDLDFKKSHPDITIMGSPQRTTFRIVVEDQHHRKYLLEQIPPSKYQHKRLIAQVLASLSEAKLDFINPYIPNKENKVILRIDGLFWQLQKYLDGVPLDRSEYVFDSWRGKVLADVLIKLWDKTKNIQDEFQLQTLSLKEYTSTMVEKMRKHNPDELKKLQPVLDYVSSDFFRMYDQIPRRFCHGDFHPLNIIWDVHGIKAVIDWEFMGINIETYDMANLLGCVGIEDPYSLVNGFVLEFLRKIKQSKYISEIGFRYLFDCMLALRFAWLAEWFRNNDDEMISLEIDFLLLLLKNEAIINTSWSEL